MGRCVTLCLLALLFSFPQPLLAGGEGKWRFADSVVARIDEGVVTYSDLLAEIEFETWAGVSKSTTSEKVVAEIVRRKLLVAQAEKLRMDLPETEIDAKVEELSSAGRGKAAFWERMNELGLGRDEVRKRFREVSLTRSFIALKRRSTYVAEADVRAFYRENKSRFGDRPLAEARDEVREELAAKKYGAELAAWIDSQIRMGRVRFLPLPETAAR